MAPWKKIGKTRKVMIFMELFLKGDENEKCYRSISVQRVNKKAIEIYHKNMPASCI